MRLLGLTVAALALAAGSGDEPPWMSATAQPDDLRFSVVAEQVGRALVVRGTIESKRSVPVSVGFSACFSRNVLLRLYRAQERKPPAIWESTPEICQRSLLVANIPAHGSISPRWLVALLAADALPESVVDGTYFATADIKLAQPRMTSGEIPAGVLVVHGR